MSKWIGKLNKEASPPTPTKREIASPPTPLRKERGVITEKGNRNSM